jgi:hypothetical protein
MNMVERTRNLIRDWIPAWLPIVLSICGGAFYIGQSYQKVLDRLDSVEKQIVAIQQYISHEHEKGTADPLPLGVASSQHQDAGSTLAVHY